MNTSIAFVPLSDPRARFERFAFGLDFFFALNWVRFTAFIDLLIRSGRARSEFADGCRPRHGESVSPRRPDMS